MTTLLIASSSVQLATTNSMPTNTSVDRIDNALKVISVDVTTSNPVKITSNSDFASQATANSWPGSGTSNDPYIIENYFFTGGTSTIPLLSISNVTAYFIVRDNIFDTIYNAVFIPKGSGGEISANGIFLHNVFSSSVSNGIVLESAENMTFSRNQFQNLYKSIDFKYYNTFSNIEISNNQFATDPSDNCNAVTVGGSMDGFILSNNTFTENGGYLYPLTISTTSPIYNLLIFNNTVTTTNGRGIVIYGSNGFVENVTISMNEISVNNLQPAIDVVSLKAATITDNQVISGKYGIQSQTGDDILFSNNVVNSTLAGIYIDATSTNNSLVGNSLENNGLLLDTVDPINVFSGNTLDGGLISLITGLGGTKTPADITGDVRQLILYLSSNLELMNFDISSINVFNSTGNFTLSNSKVNRMLFTTDVDNTTVSNSFVASLVKTNSNSTRISDSEVSNIDLHDKIMTTITNSTSQDRISMTTPSIILMDSRLEGGVLVYSALSGTISNNYFSYLTIWTSQNLIVADNVFRSESGLTLASSSSNQIHGNIIYVERGYTPRGIALVDSSFNDVYWNYILSGNTGVLMTNGDYNTIHNNTVVNSYHYVFDIDSASSNNGIYHNNFISRINSYFTYHYLGSDSGTSNYFESNSIGNYWKDPVPVDANQDGIADSSVSMDGSSGSVDNSPSASFVDSPFVDIAKPVINSVWVNGSSNQDQYLSSFHVNIDLNITENSPIRDIVVFIGGTPTSTYDYYFYNPFSEDSINDLRKTGEYNVNKTLSLTLPTFGRFNYTFQVTDSFGFSTNYSMIINVVYDPLPPQISHYDDFSVIPFETVNLQWNISEDLGPTETQNSIYYTFAVNGTDFYQEDYGQLYSSTDIVDYLVNETLSFIYAGQYEVSIIVYDSSGRNATDIVIITVLEDTSPPTLNQPSDITYQEDTSNQPSDYEIYWEFHDTSANGESFYVYKNGTQIVIDDWTLNGNVSIPVGNLSAGTYNFSIVVRDFFNNIAHDWVLVTVSPGSQSSSTTTTTTSTTSSSNSISTTKTTSTVSTTTPSKNEESPVEGNGSFLDFPVSFAFLSFLMPAVLLRSRRKGNTSDQGSS